MKLRHGADAITQFLRTFTPSGYVRVGRLTQVAAVAGISVADGDAILQDAAMAKRTCMVLVACVSLSCGDSSGEPPARPDGGSGSRADAAPDVDAGRRDAGVDVPDASHDAGSGETDAGSGGPIIDSVFVDDSFTEVHQAMSFAIRITGTGLAEVTEVVFVDGSVEPGSLIATATEIRATMFVDGRAVPGPRDVTVRGPALAVTALAAIEVTPWVFGADAASGGRGTFESPLLLAEFDDDRQWQSWGGILHFLAGEHVQDQLPINVPGATMVGEGVDVTTVRVRSVYMELSPSPVAVRDLTLAGMVIDAQGGGDLVVERVRMTGGSFSILGTSGAGSSQTVSFDDFSYAGPEPGGSREPAIRGQGGMRLLVSRSHFTSCSTAISSSGREVVVTDSVIEGCEAGLRASGGPRSASQEIRVQVTRSEFVDNGVAIELFNASAEVTASAIYDNEATAATSQQGIDVCWGALAASDLTIAGQDVSGISGNGCDPGDDDVESILAISLTRVLVEGGQFGIRTAGYADRGILVMRSSIVRDQTVAALSIGQDADRFRTNFLSVAEDNQLSVVSGYALEDARSITFEAVYIQAGSVLLNGRTYTGVVEGPADVPPDYRVLRPDSGIVFAPAGSRGRPANRAARPR